MFGVVDMLDVFDGPNVLETFDACDMYNLFDTCNRFDMFLIYCIRYFIF